MLITGFATGSTEANCYFIAPRAGAGAVVIDPGEEAVQTLEYYFAANDLHPVAVLLTNGHPAHSASAADLSAGWDIPVLIHPADRGLLTGGGQKEPDEVIDLAGGARLELAGMAVTVDHTPGRSPGSVVFGVTADTDEGPVPVVFTGDTLAARGCGETGDPVRAAESAREKLFVLDDRTVVLPGHGPSTSIGAQRRLHLAKDCNP
ncbi:MAG TPA: MBL fold metallo-hydrolase [Mycobacterium sp.]|nr:MBL fold metallo-hydrolase [Mycobacterium sp.]